LSRYSQHGGPSFEFGTPVRATVKWFNATKGFGFVAPSDGTPDAFLHVSVLANAGHDSIGDGADLMCMIAPGAKGPQVSRVLEVLSLGSASGEAPRRDAPPSRDRVSRDFDAPEVEVSGTVKWFKPDKGFGFVTADDQSKDVFVHKSVLRRCGPMMLESGQRVQMRVQEADKGREATWITPL
jgi:CspA family cold shock protein